MDKPRKNQLFPDVLVTKKKKEQLLTNSKTFCTLPWMHMYISPNGDTLPCCIANWEKPLGNTNRQTIKEVWSDTPYKTLRLNMINGIKSSNCNACYQHETTGGSSMREWSNRVFSNQIDLLNNMNYDGSMKNVEWRYFDVRFSNICNFKCRTCNDHFSSSWVEEDNKYNHSEDRKWHAKIHNASSEDHPLWPQYKDMLPKMQIINFAGGEPLITPEHYEVLEYLIEKNSTQIQLKYSSNLSVLKFKNKNIIELWKHFPDILLMASLDATGPRAEYIRSGTIWKNQITNLKKIKALCPHIKLTFNSVISLFNVLTFTDLLDELMAEGIYDPSIDSETSPTFYRMHSPECLSVKVLDPETKQEVREHLTQWLESVPNAGNSLTNSVKDIIEFMEEDLHNQYAVQTKKEIDRIDARRGENFVETFPELERFYRSLPRY